MRHRLLNIKRRQKGFTLIELLVVIAIIGLLAAIVLIGLSDARESAYYSRALQDLRSIEQAAQLYYNRHGRFPDDVPRDTMPSGLEDFMSGQEWPPGPYPASVYDWEYWPADILAHPPFEDVYQVSIRFCDYAGTVCRFPREEWAEDFDTHSAMYWCMEGPCRAHGGRPFDHPGYCVNCGNHPGHHPSLSP